MGVRTLVTRHLELRRMRGLSLAKTAGALGVTTNRVFRVESREIPASPEYRKAFSRLVRVRERDIFDADGWVL